MRNNKNSNSHDFKSSTSSILQPTALAIAISMAASGSPHAATINVGAGCSVVEAVTAANDNVVVNACVAGDDNADTVVLQASTVYSISVASLFQDIGDGMGTLEPNSAFPLITSDITIQGNGSTIERAAAAATDFRLFYVANSGTLSLESVTLSNGLADGASNRSRSGGAIYSRGPISLDSVTISGNSADFRGGGINVLSALTVVNSTITANTANDQGGGINNGGSSASISITNSSLTNNNASVGGAVKGYSSGGNMIIDSVITGNSATFSGGGLSISRSNIYVYGTNISNNYGRARGSAIEVFELTDPVENVFVMDDCIISGNTGNGYAVSSDVSTTITYCSITQNTFNTASPSGGAVGVFPKAVSLDNLTISQNDGYGVRAEGPSMTFSNSSVTLNSGRGGSLTSATVTNSSFSNNYNGGLQVSYSTGSYLTIDGNSAANENRAGGLNAFSGTFDHITITNNTTDSQGGGLFAYNTQLSDSTVTGNSATQSGGGASLRGSVSLTDVYIAYNESYGGGGIYARFADELNFTRLNLVSNSATTYPGGGIYLRQSTATLSNSTINGSVSQSRGGGIHVSSSDLLIDGSTISGNRSNQSGGGIFALGNVEITNSTFFANSATQYGGAIYASSGFVTTSVRNSTITSNTASSGGGVATNNYNPMLTLQATIIENSTGGDCHNSPLDGENNWFEDASCNGVASGSPMLDAPTGSPLVFPLLPGSGAIDAGGECGLEIDQVGTPRSICKCDVGAFEVLELTPDNTSCKGSFFVIPTANGKTVIIDL